MEDSKYYERKNIPRFPTYHYKFTKPIFITMNAKRSLPLFGSVKDGVWHPDPAGKMVEQWFYRIEDHFSEVRCDVFQCMPTHVHFILAPRYFDTQPRYLNETLMEVMQWYKSRTTNAYIDGVRRLGWPRFPNQLWHRSYYESLITSTDSWLAVRHYIRNNPKAWRNRAKKS